MRIYLFIEINRNMSQGCTMVHWLALSPHSKIQGWFQPSDPDEDMQLWKMDGWTLDWDRTSTKAQTLGKS